MRKNLTVLAIALGLIATSANADQKTLAAIQDAGIELTEAQASELKAAKCNGSDCSALTEKVAEIVAANSDNDNAVSAILKAASSAHPEQATQFGEAAIAAAPNAVATIAQVMQETAATAAGGPPGNQGENGRSIVRGVANPNNNIPSPPGGGGSSSPS
jgi:hypothetical protein